MNNIQVFLYFLWGSVFILLLGWVGNADFEQAQLSEELYCERVAEGVHNDYLKNDKFGIDCSKYN